MRLSTIETPREDSVPGGRNHSGGIVPEDPPVESVADGPYTGHLYLNVKYPNWSGT